MGARPRARSEPAADRTASNDDLIRASILGAPPIMARRSGFNGVNDLSPDAPFGHADGSRPSTWLTESVKHTHRKHAMNTWPQHVIAVLVAGVKNWALVDLHGYVGYLREPRATQDVEGAVSFGQRRLGWRVFALCNAGSRVWRRTPQRGQRPVVGREHRNAGTTWAHWPRDGGRLLGSVRHGTGEAASGLVRCKSRWFRSFDVTVGCGAGGWLGGGTGFRAPRCSNRDSR